MPFCRALAACSPPLPAHPVIRGSQRSTNSLSLTTLPALTTEAVAEALGVLAAHDADPAIFAEALGHLAAGVIITADGADYQIDSMRVHRAPVGESWPWPWRCACGAARCWHGAMVEGVALAWERLGDDGRPLPFEVPISL